MPIEDIPNVATRHARPRVRTALIAIAMLASLVALPSPQRAAASDTSTRWDSFSESSGCGDPFTRGPYASRSGPLADSEAIMGTFGSYFGRTIGEVRSDLRWWPVPYSGGMRVQVHRAILPSLQRVTAGLRAHAEQGRIYQITTGSAFVPRTIGGRYRISRHAMGLAIDLNPLQNPHRTDGVLITNMPDWYVQTWRDAGFCWGGDWSGGAKDPMHFAWMGPGSTPWDTDSLDPLQPKTKKTAFRGPAGTYPTEFAPVMSRYVFGISDAISNGTSDVIGLRSHPAGSVIDVARSSLGFGACSIGRWFVEDQSVSGADHLVFADIDGDSGEDLVALTASGSSFQATTATKREDYEDVTTITTGAGADAVDLTGADFDGDHTADLWEATSDGRLRVWRGPGFTQLLDESDLPGGAPHLISAGDRDGGDTPELYALYSNDSGSRIDVLSHAGSWARETSINLGTSPSEIAAIGAGDYDGDGRSDAQVFTADGRLTQYIGNTSTGAPADRWFTNRDFRCGDHPVLLDFEGSFMDDEGNIFSANIESIAAVGVTKGCNPPFNDRFCPGSRVTREQMAAFLVRALDLTPDDHPGFADVPADNTFVDDIGKLATAGITKGCNPPANDEFCPKDLVSREQMAAFLVRALELTADRHPGFGDVPADNTFVIDISKLATAGITRGCNPPVNDRFCPTDSVTREQMAAFLDRAGLGT